MQDFTLCSNYGYMNIWFPEDCSLCGDFTGSPAGCVLRFLFGLGRYAYGRRFCIALAASFCKSCADLVYNKFVDLHKNSLFC